MGNAGTRAFSPARGPATRPEVMITPVASALLPLTASPQEAGPGLGDPSSQEGSPHTMLFKKCDERDGADQDEIRRPRPQFKMPPPLPGHTPPPLQQQPPAPGSPPAAESPPAHHI